MSETETKYRLLGEKEERQPGDQMFLDVWGHSGWETIDGRNIFACNRPVRRPLSPAQAHAEELAALLYVSGMIIERMADDFDLDQKETMVSAAEGEPEMSASMHDLLVSIRDALVLSGIDPVNDPVPSIPPAQREVQAGNNSVQ